MSIKYPSSKNRPLLIRFKDFCENHQVSEGTRDFCLWLYGCFLGLVISVIILLVTQWAFSKIRQQTIETYPTEGN